MDPSSKTMSKRFTAVDNGPLESNEGKQTAMNGKGSNSNDEESFDFDATKYFQKLKESRQKPRDIIEGATCAIQTLLFGSMASVSTFVGIPVASMAVAVKSKLASITNSTQELKLVGDVAIPAILGLIGGGIVGGISTFSIAMYSMYRATVSLWEGIMETPFAMKSWIIERRIWNPYERKWKDPRQTLEDERRELLLLIEEQEAENARKKARIGRCRYHIVRSLGGILELVQVDHQEGLLLKGKGYPPRQK